MKKKSRNVVRDDSFYRLLILVSLLQPPLPSLPPSSAGSFSLGQGWRSGARHGDEEFGSLRLGASTDLLPKAVCPFVGSSGGRQGWDSRAGWIYSHLTQVWDAHGVGQGLVAGWELAKLRNRHGDGDQGDPGDSASLKLSPTWVRLSLIFWKAPQKSGHRLGLGAKAGGPGCELYPGGGDAINCWLVEYQALAELFMQTGSDSWVQQEIAEFVRKYHSPGICSAIHISLCVCVSVSSGGTDISWARGWVNDKEPLIGLLLTLGE